MRRLNLTPLLAVFMLSAPLAACDSEEQPPITTTCPEGQSLCSGVCIDVNTSADHCGACGVECAAGDACVAGACQNMTACGAGESMCGDSCVNTSNDSAHCGGCNNSCGSGAVCQAGSCACGSADLTYCGTSCVNTMSDEQNCGACLNACDAGDTCVEGVCRQERGEACNNLDDDLDGIVDEGANGGPYTEPCDSSCGSGVRDCNQGQLTACSAPMPSTEVCDGLDNDCDGLVDEGVAMTYYEDADRDGYGNDDPMTAKLACSAPAAVGPNGGPYIERGGDCDDDDNTTYPTAEELPGGDNDCDGTADEGLECMVGTTSECGVNVGECRPGVQTCGDDATLGACGGPGYVGPEDQDLCDGRDEDCDGLIDEGGEDAYELSTGEMDPRGNEVCGDATRLPNVEDNVEPLFYENMSIYRTNLQNPVDVDQYLFKAAERVNLLDPCTPFTAQCMQFAFDFTLPNGAVNGDYSVCLSEVESDDPCAPVYTICQDDPDVVYNEANGTYSFTVEWGGRCTFNDDRYFRVEVRGAGAELNSCEPYSMAVAAFSEDQACAE
jgi:hypothetical protein